MAMPDDKNDRKIAGEALQGALVDLLDHLKFDDVVAMVRTQADEVAERAETIGVSPDGQAATIATTSVLSAFTPGWVKDTEALTALSSALFAVIDRMQGRITVLDATDPVTQDLLIGVVADLEKHHWMFRAESGIPAQINAPGWDRVCRSLTVPTAWPSHTAEAGGRKRPCAGAIYQASAQYSASISTRTGAAPAGSAGMQDQLPVEETRQRLSPVSRWHRW